MYARELYFINILNDTRIQIISYFCNRTPKTIVCVGLLSYCSAFCSYLPPCSQKAVCLSSKSRQTVR